MAYSTNESGRYEVVVTSFPTDTPVALFQTRMRQGGPADDKHQYDVSTDGRFLINEMVNDASSAPPVTLILNGRPKQK